MSLTDCVWFQARIEGARYKHEPQMLLEGGAKTLALTDGKSKGKGGAKRKKGGGDATRSDDSDDDSEEDDYEPEEYVPKTKKQKPAAAAPAPAKKASKNAGGSAAAAVDLTKPAPAAAAAAVTGPSGKAPRGLVKARKTADGVMEYKVRWEDLGKEEDTWVASDALPDK